MSDAHENDWQVMGQQLARNTRAIFAYQDGVVRIKLRLVAARDADGRRPRGGPQQISIFLDADQRAEFSRLFAEVSELAHDARAHGAADEAPTREEVNRCGWSEDPYHRCNVCYDYAAGREREHPLTAAQEAGGDGCPLCGAEFNRDGSCSKSCAGVGDG